MAKENPVLVSESIFDLIFFFLNFKGNIYFSRPFKLMLPLKFKKVEWIVGHVLSSGI